MSMGLSLLACRNRGWTSGAYSTDLVKKDQDEERLKQSVRILSESKKHLLSCSDRTTCLTTAFVQSTTTVITPAFYGMMETKSINILSFDSICSGFSTCCDIRVFGSLFFHPSYAISDTKPLGVFPRMHFCRKRKLQRWHLQQCEMDNGSFRYYGFLFAQRRAAKYIFWPSKLSSRKGRMWRPSLYYSIQVPGFQDLTLLPLYSLHC